MLNGRLDLNGFTITGAEGYGINCFTTCKIVGPGTITGATFGVAAEKKIKLFGVTVTGNKFGVWVKAHKGNGWVEVRDSTITGNTDAGIVTDSFAKVTDSVISGNGGDGITVGAAPCSALGRLRLVDATVSDNGVNPECGVSLPCNDVSTCRVAPRLDGASTCGSSYVVGSGLPGDSWGVCSSD